MAKSVARIRLKPEGIDAFRACVAELAEPTRAEEGCLFYEFYQSDEDPTVCYFLEEWRSQADLEKHLKTPHVAKFAATADVNIAAPVEPIKWHRVL